MPPTCLPGLEGSRKAATKASTLSKPPFHRRASGTGAARHRGPLTPRPRFQLVSCASGWEPRALPQLWEAGVPFSYWEVEQKQRWDGTLHAHALRWGG